MRKLNGPRNIAEFASILYQLSIATLPIKVVSWRYSMAANSSPSAILASSSIATLCAALICNPLDVIKTRQMMSANASLSETLPLLLKSEGTKALLKGAVPALAVGATANAIYFLLYESFKNKVAGLIGHFGYGVTAFWSRVVAVVVTIPVEVARTRAYAGSNSEGDIGYRGLQSQIWRDTLWSFITWQIYETLLPADALVTSMLLCAIVGAVIGSALTHPLDFLKTKQQLDCNLPENPISGLKEMWKTIGINVITQGLVIHCVEAALAISVFILVYTFLLSLSDSS